jgi:hypothetical protein
VIAQWYSAGLWAGCPGFRVPAGAGNFSPHHRVQNGSGTHPGSYPVGTRGSFPGVKLPGREADHSPPSNAEVKNAWSYTSTPSVRLHCVVLSKAQEQVYFFLYFNVTEVTEELTVHFFLQLLISNILYRCISLTAYCS